MKKILCIAIMLLAFIQTVNSMIPGPTLLLSCPKCGDEKAMMSIISGNTFGASQWSDMYQYAPMLPRLSPVQKCKKCGGYYLLSNAESRYAEDEEDLGYSFETGRLTYKEMKEALRLLEDSTLSKDAEMSIRLEFLHRYNDAFREFEGENYEKSLEDGSFDHGEEDIKLHHANLRALIALLDENDSNDVLLIAELYREGANFEECMSLLDKYYPDSEFLNNIKKEMFDRAIKGDANVFLISED